MSASIFAWTSSFQIDYYLSLITERSMANSPFAEKAVAATAHAASIIVLFICFLLDLEIPDRRFPAPPEG